MLICSDDQGTLSTAAALGYSVLLTPQAGPQVLPWPCGAKEALEAARQARPACGLILANPSCLTLDAPLLKDFLHTLRLKPTQPLVSVRECRDHPCQAQRFLRIKDMLTLSRSQGRQYLPPLQDQYGELAVKGLTWPEQKRWSWVRTEAGQHLLRAEGLGQVLVHCDALDADGRMLANASALFRDGQLELALGVLPASVRTLLVSLLECSASDYHFMRPAGDMCGLWRWQADGSIYNEKDQKIVAGRQDFPQIYQPDALLAYLPEVAPDLGWNLPDLPQCEAYALPQDMPARPGDPVGFLAAAAYLRARREQP
jgi:hypothetical protein